MTQPVLGGGGGELEAAYGAERGKLKHARDIQEAGLQLLVPTLHVPSCKVRAMTVTLST